MEEEIDLKELFLVIWKRKHLIVITFILFAFLGLICSLTRPKIYEAKATIMITPSKVEFIKNPMEAPLSFTPSNSKNDSMHTSISISDHLVLLKSGIVAERIYERLKKEGVLEKVFEKEPQIDAISGMLEPKQIKGSSMIELNVKSSSPTFCALLANVWGEVYINIVRELVSGEATVSRSFLQEQLKNTEKELENKKKELADFNLKYNLEMKENELSIKKSKLKKIQKEISDKTSTLESKKIYLAKLQQEIKKHPQYKKVGKAVGDETLWSSVAEGKDPAKFKNKKLYSEVINPVYQDLEQKIADTSVEVSGLEDELKYLKIQEEKLKKEVLELQGWLNKKNFQRDQISREYEMAKSKYSSIFTRVRDADLILSANLGDVKLISKALPPQVPVSPRKKAIVAISGFIGLFCGFVLVFVAEFYEKNLKPI